MNPENFFIPGYFGMRGMPISGPAIRGIGPTVKNAGLFSKIANGVRSFNWGGLLNNANKTLNVVNQAIPLVRQAGPMVSNMRSMLKIAKVFGNETTNKQTVNNIIKSNNSISISKKNNNLNNTNTINKEFGDSSPNFFI